MNSVTHGDCLEVLKEVDDNCIDMILCDLPYGYTRCAWDSLLPLDDLFYHYMRVIRKRGAIVLTASLPFTAKLVAHAYDNFASAWVWHKKKPGNFVQAKRQQLKVHEDVLVFSKDGRQPLYYPQKVPRESSIVGRNKKGAASSAIPLGGTLTDRVYFDRYPTSLITVPHDKECYHPTQKPVALFAYLIETYTLPNGVVLDNCAGSGTTAIACMRTGRNFLLIEKEEEYVRLAKRRIIQEARARRTD